MLAGVDASTGQVFGGRQIAASEDGHRDAVRWAREQGSECVWAIEDCRHVSRRLEQRCSPPVSEWCGCRRR
jgi:hypothetical protein